MDKEQKRNRYQREPNNGVIMGKIPPQNIEAEEVVLGAILLNSQSIILILDLFKPDVFYMEAHQIISRVILEMYNSSKKIDIITVSKELRVRGDLELIGGGYYLTKLTERIGSSNHIQDHIKIIYESYIQREMIRCFVEKTNDCYQLADPFDTLTATTRFLDELQQGTMTHSETPVHQLAMEAVNYRQNHPGIKEMLGLSTGFSTLDKAIGGWQRGHLVIIAARPAMGKTAFALAIAKHIGMELKKPVAFFSLEMVGEQLYIRLQASVSGIDSKKIRMNDLNEEEHILLNQADGQLSNSKLFIDDTPALAIDKFRAKLTIMKHKYGIEAAVIDYLQLMKGSKSSFNREGEIAEISGKLKQTAKELNMPIIALSQLSRETEKRAGGSNIPKLTDLRESGAIEQDADTVLMLWRPAYYDIENEVEFRHFGLDLMPKNLLMIVIAKQRDGDTYNLPLHIQLAIMKITDHPAVVGVGNEGQTESNQQAIFKFVKEHPDPNEDETPF